MYVLPAWPEKTQATFQKPVDRPSVHSNKYILIEKSLVSKFVFDMQGQVGRSQELHNREIVAKRGW